MATRALTVTVQFDGGKRRWLARCSSSDFSSLPLFRGNVTVIGTSCNQLTIRDAASSFEKCCFAIRNIESSLKLLNALLVPERRDLYRMT
jgi:hypothetical protein